MKKHTPTPWKSEKATNSFLGINRNVPVGSRYTFRTIGHDAVAQANAEHIVRCVNSHDALVEALGDISDECNEYGSDNSIVIAMKKRANVALALVKQ